MRRILAKFKKLYLIVQTVRYLKFRQIYFRVVHSLNHPSPRKTESPPLPERPTNWRSFALYTTRISDDFEACFLNQKRKLEFPTCWNDERLDKLWIYNLHYFEDVLSDTAQAREAFLLAFIHRWIEQNPPAQGNGWEPYTISLRVTNILKAWAGGLQIDDVISSSLYQQADFLTRVLEKHLLGNHYFVNLKALLFAGVIFDNDEWINLAITGLSKEIPEQILDDGMHFELSPMYHRLALVDMLDICNLTAAFPSKVSADFSNLVNEKIRPMLHAMTAMTHPDCGVSFFNDSVERIAPSFQRIKDYAEVLGYVPELSDEPLPSINDMSHSGYMVAQTRDSKLIFDAAAVGPDYIPGHAHADTLSFEMSIGLERVFVNSGISEYNVSKKRLAERSTAAHNTIEVDGRNSSEVWSSFRVAKRARILHRNAKCDANGCELSGSHLGYRSITGGAVHSRDLAISDRSLIVDDTLDGNWRSAVSRFHFHPDLDIYRQANSLHIKGETFVMSTDLTGLDARLVDSTWHPEFGRSEPNKCLEINFLASSHKVVFTWERS